MAANTKLACRFMKHVTTIAGFQSKVEPSIGLGGNSSIVLFLLYSF